MSLHSSLKIDTAGAQQRSVLTRIERVKEMMKKGLWPEGRKAVGLPKTRIVRIKARKAAKEAKAEGAAAGAPAGAAKPAAGGKSAGAPGAPKK